MDSDAQHNPGDIFSALEYLLRQYCKSVDFQLNVRVRGLNRSSEENRAIEISSDLTDASLVIEYFSNEVAEDDGVCVSFLWRCAAVSRNSIKFSEFTREELLDRESGSQAGDEAAIEYYGRSIKDIIDSWISGNIKCINNTMFGIRYWEIWKSGRWVGSTNWILSAIRSPFGRQGNRKVCV